MAIDAVEAGTVLRDGLKDGPNAQRRLAQRERLVLHASARAPSKARPWLWALLGASLAALLVVVFAAFEDAPSTPATPATPAALGEQHALVAATTTNSTHVAFEDGSRIELANGALGYVHTNSADAVEVIVHDGRLVATVEPDSKRQWTITAGPFEIVVVGTIFAVDWDAGAEELTVEVMRGEVNVRGGSALSGRGIAVRAGQQLSAIVSTDTVTLSHRDEEPPTLTTITSSGTEVPTDGGLAPDDEPPGLAPTQPAGAAGAAGAAGTENRRRRASVVRPTWLSESKAGNFKAALALAKSVGFERLVVSLGADDLRRLADTARLGRDRTRAEAAYLAIRRRFPQTRIAGQAAFQIGRLHAANAKGQRRAAKWFRRYLSERPKGAYAREATGRLMQSLVGSGERSAATAVAERYLASYPNGPHAKLARSLF